MAEVKYKAFNTPGGNLYAWRHLGVLFFFFFFFVGIHKSVKLYSSFSFNETFIIHKKKT
jgi:hypothetical protein